MPSEQTLVRAVSVKARCLIGAALLWGISASASAAVHLGRPFSDGMVLQRDAADPVWGTADAGERVTVHFAGQEKSATADANGHWRVTLDAVAASAEPRTMTVQGTNTVNVGNVLVGEVWFCSGQSNMEVGLERLLTSKYPSDDVKATALARIHHELENPAAGVRLFRAATRADDTQKNIWTDCTTDVLRNQKGRQGFSAVAYFFGQKLAAGLRVPIGLIEASVGGTTIETWTPPHGKNFVPLVAPIAPFRVRGVIWYQGESNLIQGDDAGAYAAKVQTLIRSWRDLWGERDLPFYYVELPPMPYSHRRDKVRHTPEALAVLREGQAAALQLPHTGRIITTDLAPADDLHPFDKWDVGHRLAALALAQVYQRGGDGWQYPTLKAMHIEGGRAILSFADVDGGLKSRDGKPLTDFEVAGADRKFVPATATISGDTVAVSNPAVADPQAVRFAWNETARPNLCTVEGLPAAPFRTDTWPVQIVAPTSPGEAARRQRR